MVDFDSETHIHGAVPLTTCETYILPIYATKYAFSSLATARLLPLRVPPSTTPWKARVILDVTRVGMGICRYLVDVYVIASWLHYACKHGILRLSLVSPVSPGTQDRLKDTPAPTAEK